MNEIAPRDTMPALTPRSFLTERNISPQTFEAYRDCVVSYYRYLEDTGKLEGIESVHTWLSGTKNASTSRLRKTAIRSFLLKKFEHESPERIMELERFFKRIKSKKSEQRQFENDYLTYDEVMTLAEGATDIISCLILALFWTGCRVSELINMELENCKTGKYITIRVMGKGSKERDVFMPRDLYMRIRKVFKGKTYLFETRNGRQYHRVAISKEIDRQARQILGYSVTAHRLRHSKAMYLKDERGLSPDQVSKALGHSSVITSLRFYFHGTPSASDQGIV